MEGLLPTESWQLATARVKIPCLSSLTRAAEDIPFEEFPRYSGLGSIEDVTSLRLSFPTVLSLATFMQSWLFFELLSAFLRRPFDRSDFITDGFINLDQDAVHQHFRRWKAMLRKGSYAKQRAIERAARVVIDHALRKSDLFEGAADSFGSSDERFDHVALSVKLLASLLLAILDDTCINSHSLWAPWVHTAAFGLMETMKVVEWFFKRTKDPRFDFVDEYLSEMRIRDPGEEVDAYQTKIVPLHPSDPVGGRAASVLVNLLERNGWCPQKARQLCQSYDYLTVNRIAGLVRYQPSSEDHSRCLEKQRCVAHDLDDKKPYPFRHECDGTCKFVHICHEKIAGIIQNGKIPIVSCKLYGEPDLEIIERKNQTVYTAISHIWSDGLGNRCANALPLCQLEWLRQQIYELHIKDRSEFFQDETVISRWTFAQRVELVEGLYDPEALYDTTRVFFWMDTLCIPVDPRELKLQAIAQITPVFAGAVNTLIIDRNLQGSLGSPCSHGNKIHGDEFAALVLGSKWMERGWTLQEGCISRNCVFQQAEKPYSMIPSLHNQIPKLDSNHSPLDRVFIRNRWSTVTLLKKTLLEDRKRIQFEPWPFSPGRVAKRLRLYQFVRTWNSLINRSTTKAHDGALILANLLDLDVFPLRHIDEEEWLMVVIQSCEVLPLALMYNTGPRMCIKGHSELGWIPQYVAGNSLTIAATMRMIKHKQTHGRVTYFIERRHSDQQHLLIMSTRQGEYIPCEMATFRVKIPSKKNNYVDIQEFFIEIQQTALPQVEETGITDTEINMAPIGTCIAMDFSYGTQRAQGFAARGARFLVHAQSRTHMELGYDAPLIVRTPEQWMHQARQVPMPTPFVMERIPLNRALIMTYDATLWRGQLPKMPLFNQYPASAQVITLLIGVSIVCLWMLLVNWLMAKVPEEVKPLVWTVVILLNFLVAKYLAFATLDYIYQPIRRKLVAVAYEAWQRSFEGNG